MFSKKAFLFVALLATSCIYAETTDDQTVTPSGKVYTEENPQLELSFLTTYNRNPDQEELNPKPMDEIPKSDTKYVYPYIEFKNLLYKEKDQEHKLTFKFFLERGTLLGEQDLSVNIKKDWEYAWYYGSWGWKIPGRWPAGTHTVEVWVDDTKFAEKKFTITPE